MSRTILGKTQIDEIENKFKASDDTPIFRYMDFSKFMDLLENKHLFFCNAQYFEDEYEGKIPEGFYKGWSKEARDGHEPLSEMINEYFKGYISCWNKGEVESYSLWKIYTNPNTGIAIKSTVGDLKKALDNHSIKMYKAEYVDFKEKEVDCEPPCYSREVANENGLMITRDVVEVYKDMPYAYENEIRAVYITNIEKNGINFGINLSTLINEIYISPFASEWFDKLVHKIAKKECYNISDKPICKSEIRLRKNA